MNDDRLYKQLDRMESRLDSVDVRLAKYNSELEFHVSRTVQLEDELLPVVKHVEQMRGAGKLLVIIATAATIAGGLAWIWTK